MISNKFPNVAREHIESLLVKFLNIDAEKKVVGFSALFEILMILKRELNKEKNDEMKYSHFLCTLERANQDKLKLAIVQLKCVPCLNKFTTNFNLLTNSNNSNLNNNSGSLNSQSNSSNSSSFSHANMSRLLKQMSLIVSTELQQIAIDLIEKLDDEKPVKYIKLKEEFRMNSLNSNQTSVNTNSISSSSSVQSSNSVQSSSQPAANSSSLLYKQQQQINNLMQMKNLAASFAKKVDLSTNNSSSGNKPQIFNPHSNLQQFMSQDQKAQELSPYGVSMHERTSSSTNAFLFSDRY